MYAHVFICEDNDLDDLLDDPVYSAFAELTDQEVAGGHCHGSASSPLAALAHAGFERIHPLHYITLRL